MLSVTPQKQLCKHRAQTPFLTRTDLEAWLPKFQTRMLACLLPPTAMARCSAGLGQVTQPILRTSVCINLVQKPAHQPVVPEQLTCASKQQKSRRLQRAGSKEGQLHDCCPPQPDVLGMGCRSQSPDQRCRKAFSRSTTLKACQWTEILGGKHLPPRRDIISC